jgi:hypothetical protein
MAIVRLTDGRSGELVSEEITPEKARCLLRTIYSVGHVFLVIS